MSLIVRGAAVVFALTWLSVPGWGAVDLSVSWSADWNPVLSGGWGLYFSVLVAVPFLFVALRPRAAAPAIWTLVVASICLLLSSLVSLEPQIVGLLVWLLIGIAAVALPAVVERWYPLSTSIHVRRLSVVVVTAVPWLAYAWVMAGRSRQDRADTDVSSGVDHYSVQAALALSMFALVVLAACWARGQRQVGTYVAVCSIYLGALSLGWPGYPGSVETQWAVYLVLWGVAVGLLAWLSPRSSRTSTTLDTTPGDDLNRRVAR